jgi:hypothetical protein
MEINIKPISQGNKAIDSFQALVGWKTWFQLMEENFYGSIFPSKYGSDI